MSESAKRTLRRRPRPPRRSSPIGAEVGCKAKLVDTIRGIKSSNSKGVDSDSADDVGRGPEALGCERCFVRLLAATERALLRPSTRVYGKGATLETANADRGSFFIIRNGSVRLIYSNTEGVEHIVAIVGPGEFVGVEELFVSACQGLSAVARQRSEVCIVDRFRLREIFVSLNPGIAALLRGQSEALHRRTLNLMLRTEPRACTRLCSALHRGFLPLAGSEAGVARLTQRELAGIAGLREETVSRRLRSSGDNLEALPEGSLAIANRVCARDHESDCYPHETE